MSTIGTINLFKYWEIIVGIFIVVYIITSDFTIKYLSRKLANNAANITNEFKEKGMNKVEIKGKINMGLVSFEVIVQDKIYIPSQNRTFG